MSVVQVEPLLTTRAVRGPFDYARPEGVDLEVGSLLRVPFAGRTVRAVVTGFVEQSEHKLSPVADTEPHSIPADLVDLALWIARQYASTPARALSLAAPARDARPKEVLWAELTDAGAIALGEGSGERLTAGQREAMESLPARATERLQQLRRLEARGLVVIAPRVERRVPDTGFQKQQAHAPALTDEQQVVLDRILSAGPSDRLLLHGVTGSGKTEVYLRAAEAMLKGGQDVLVLVPEIGLTPQMTDRFKARFGDTVAVLHSKLSEGQRYDEWCRMRSGESKICVGPRSAVFAPLQQLGLVVVDEEHDGSYKHEGDPRYDARTVAERRAQMHGAVLVAGSATPRPESVKRMPILRMPSRVDGATLPPVEVVDLKETSSPLHPRTHEALVDSRKSIVLLNRRGWSNFLTCDSCGRVWECPNCDVALILHMAAQRVSCHHCGHEERLPTNCPDCGSVSISRHGAGTERLAAELQRLGRPVLSLDSSTGSPADVLAQFAAAPEAILLGTQVVAKGHDFPDVDLGVVVDADSTLRFPDFRSQERTFALVTQLAGRAGRGGAGSRVLVQTIDPEDETIQFAAAHDSDGFIAAELRRREALRYPPFSTLIRVHCSAPTQQLVDEAAAQLKSALPTALGPAPLFRLRGRERRQLVVKAAPDGDARLAAIDEAAAAAQQLSDATRARDVAVVVDVDPQ